MGRSLDKHEIGKIGEKQTEDALESPRVRPFDITGKPMKGWVMISKGGFKSIPPPDLQHIPIL